MGITEVTVPKQYVLVQTTEPTGAFEGQLWYDSSEDLTYIFQDDDWQLITLDISQEVLDLATENAQQQIDIIELQANASVAPFDHDTLLSDTFSDADGYKDSVNTGNTDAEFDTNLYKRQNVAGIDLTTSLVCYYKLDETTGAVVDELGTNDGTNNGATRGVAGKIGTAFDFDGSNDYINVPDSSDLSFGDGSTDSAFSFSFWINQDSLSTINYIFGKYGASNTKREYCLKINTNGTLYMILVDQSSNGALVKDTTETILINTWYHVIITYDGSSTYQGLKIYLNGDLTNDGTATKKDASYIAMENNTGALGIGRVQDTGFFDGTIDEFGIWSRALTSSEVTELYNSGSARAYEDLVIEESSALRTVEIDLPTVTGTVTHTELVTNSTIETGASITYKLNNGTTDDTEETPNTKNAYNLTGVPTKLKILLNPKEESPTSGNPSIKSYCLKLWKA